MDYISPKDVLKVVEISEMTPTKNDKKHFLDTLLLSVGVLMLSSGIIFFFAYNWKEISYVTKFVICEILLVASLYALMKVGLEKVTGKLAITVVAVVTGVLLALIGQTYQTGADPFQLFAIWAILIIPLVFVAKFSVLWLIELLLINTSIVLFYRTFRSIWGFLLEIEQALTVIFFVNLIALVLWELTLRKQWISRIVTTACTTIITVLLMYTILDELYFVSILFYILYFCGLYFFFRTYKLDILLLAEGVLSIIIIITTLLSKTLLDIDMDGFYLFLIGLIIIGLSALGGWWLKSLSKEFESDKN